MPQDFNPDERQGGQPNTSTQPGNAGANTVVGAGAQSWTLADWIDAWEQYQNGRQQEKDDLDAEKAELERELGNTTDPAERAEIQQQLREVAIDRSVVDAEYDLATSAIESGTGHFEPMSYTDWAQAGGLDPYDPATAQKFNTYMPRAENLSYNNSLNSAVESEHWFYFNVLKPIDVLSSIPINPAALIKGGLKKVISRGAKKLARSRRLARPRRQERIRGRKGNRRRRRECKRSGNPAFMPTGIPVHYDPEFALDGLIPVTITSAWYGNLLDSGPLGRGRVADTDATISRNDQGGFTYLDEDGFAINFPAPTPIPDGWVDGDTVRNTRLLQGPRRSLLFRESGYTHTFAKGDDGIWRTARMQDRHGNALEYTRGEGGRLERIATPEGLTLHFSYDDNGLRTGIDLEGTDGARVTVMRYAYDGDLLVMAESPYGERHNFAYDDRGLITAVDRNGTYQAQFEHDAQRRRTRITASTRAAPAEIRYDDVNRITTYLPGGDEGQAEHFHATPQDTIAKTVNALGIETQTIEDAEGRVGQVIDGEGGVTSTTYDADGNIASVTDAEGRHTTYVWSGDGQLALLVDNAGNAWEYDYDETGALISVLTPLGHATDIRNNAAGQPIGICRNDGFIQEFSYDEHHRLIGVTDFNGASTRFARDGFGRVTSITTTDGQQTHMAYTDQPGLAFTAPSAVTRPDGVETFTSVAAQGTEIRHVDGEGRATVYRYNGLMQLQSTTDPRGGVLSFAYDDENRLIRVTNQQGRIWQFDRDGAGRITQEVDFEGKVTMFRHDAADRVIETRHADGRIMAMEWDKTGLLMRRAVTIPGHDEPYAETYAYDERGLLISARNASAEITLGYDETGRLTSETVNGIAVESSLDCCGNRKERRIGSYHSTYDHDPLGALTGLTINDRPVLLSVFDPMGREVRRDGADGYALTHEYDSVGQLIHQVARGRFTRPDAALPVDRRRSFGWDRAMAPTAVSDPLWGLTQYQSDPNGQILAAVHGLPSAEGPPLAGLHPPDVERFAYAPTLDVTGSADEAGAFLSWTSSDGGRVTAARGPQGERILFTYDACGRTIERRVEQNGFRNQVWKFTWDGFDRLIGAQCPDGSAWAYVHDAFGRRIEKRQLRRGSGPAQPSTRFIWDGNVIAAEVTVDAGTAPDLARAVWWHFSPQGFTPLLRDEAGHVLHVIADHLGTPRELVAESGEVVWAADYRLWGGMRRLWTAVDGNAAEDLSVMWRPPTMSEARALCPIRFQGQWEDAETGLHYNRHRTYDPASAQYLSPDPIGIMGGMRANGYVHMPTGRIDPMGLNALRGNLTAAGQGLSVPWQAHHLIPCAVWGNHRGMFDSLGMQRDAASNGIALPSESGNPANPDLPIHRGSHAAYNARNEQQVSAIEQRWRRARNCAKDGAQRAAADQRAKSELQALQAQNRGIISALGAASPGINMNQCP